MLYALIEEEKRRAFPGAIARCASCDGDVIAKCGEINVWHWAHRADINCDPWHEGETAWHLQWKALFSPDQVEITIERDGMRHRADIVTRSGIVIELQHSAISVEEIRVREIFYQKMLWIFDASAPYRDDRIDFRRREGHYTFRWRHPRKHIAFTAAPSVLDLGSHRLFRLRKMYPKAPCGGWGKFIDEHSFMTWARNSTNRNVIESQYGIDS